MSDTGQKISAGRLRHVSWCEAHLGVAPVDRQTAREALLHIAKVAAQSPLTVAEWDTVRNRITHAAIPDLEIRFRELVWAIEAGDNFRTEIAVRSLLTAVPR